MNILGDSGICRLFLDCAYVKRFVLLAICCIALVSTSCEDKEIIPDNHENSLSAVKIYQTVSRAASSSSYFNEGTKYRIWAYQKGGTDDGKYVFSENMGVVATESHSHFVNMDSKENAKLKNNLTIYGFTEGTEVEPMGHDSSRPAYEIKYNGSQTPADESTVNYIYPDYMRAKLDYEAGTSDVPYSVMEFRHIMSQISVQVIQQDNGAEDGLYDLRVKDIAVKGIYDSATYDVVDDKMAIDKSGGKQTHVVWKSGESNGDEVGIYSKEVVRTLLLPTEDGDGEGISLVLTIEGDDAGIFLGNGAKSGQITVPVMDNKNLAKYLVFKPNFSYILQVAFINGGVRVVTSLPDVYPWLDGETDSSDGNESFHEQDLGAPQLFDKLQWSAYNIGAEVAKPGKGDFQKAIGFFYQSDRNIPYFPKTDANGDLIGDITNPNQQAVYPMVLTEDGKGRLYTADAAPVLNGKNQSDFIDRLDNLYKELFEKKRKIAYYGAWRRGGAGNPQQLWNNIATQPSVPGWRMPTSADFLAIMPSTPHAGNITFLKNLINKGAGNIGDMNNTIMTDENKNEIDLIYIHVPNDSKHPNYPDDKYYDTKNIATQEKMSSAPGSPNVINMSYDPAVGYKSEYVISKRNAKEDFVGVPHKRLHKDFDCKWGCIYGIKKVGTSEAYRMRWHIEAMSDTENYYALVVSRYPATASDRLLYLDTDKNNPHYYRNYDWSHPSAVLYFPIVGLVGDSDWSSNNGLMSNVGVETILATSDRPDANKNWYTTFRIKIAGKEGNGGGRSNQFVCLSIDRDGTASQIRCVRDYDYNQDMTFKNRENAKSRKNIVRRIRR